jgi:V8-like Glu-specific endopeptidase
VEIEDLEEDARFTANYHQPSIPLEKNKKDPTEQEKKDKLSWLELSPNGKLKKYKIKSLPKTPKDKTEDHGFDTLGIIVHDIIGQPTSADNTTDDDSEKRYIFNPDTRWRTSTTSFPYTVAGLLVFSGGSCTATLIGPKHILTAGHCVHQGGGGSWYSGFKFYPGQNSAPSSSTPYFGWTNAYSVTGWTQNGDFDYDFGVIALSTTNTYKGWMSFGWTSSLSSGWWINVNGYPGDKSYGTQWHSDNTLSDVETLTFRDTSLDLYPGNSGSASYSYWSDTNTRIIYGIVSADAWEQYWDFGCFCIKTRYWNQHVRITSDRFNLICNWINDANIC